MHIFKNLLIACACGMVAASSAHAQTSAVPARDIGGLELGISPEQAKDLLSGLEGDYKIQEFEGQFDYSNGQQTLQTDKFTSQIKAAPTKDKFKPSYVLTFSSPPNDGKLIHVHVDTNFELGKGPSSAVFHDALVEKYGKETRDNPIKDGQQLDWALDADKEDCLDAKVINLDLVGVDSLINQLARVTKTPENCSTYLNYSFMGDPVTKSSGNVINVGEYARFQHETNKWLAETEKNAKEALKENANSVKPVL